MEWSDWLLGAATVVLGSLLTLLIEAVRRRWRHVDDAQAAERAAEQERLQRLKRRSEEAAYELLALLDDMGEQLRDCRSYGSAPSQRDLLTITTPMRRHAVLLGDKDVRQRIEALATSIEQIPSIETMAGDPPSRIALRAKRVGVNAVGHVLSDEPLDHDDLQDYLDAIEQDWEEMERTRRDQAQ